MKKKGVIIQGSARSDGNTARVVKLLSKETGFEIIDLKTKIINQFDYQLETLNDDFLPLISNVIEKYDTIVFATPVYWYAMSGLMKAFFDRITELLKTQKELGRRLRGKNMAMVSCGSDEVLQDGFTMPFYETANYLGMNYLGDVHTWIEEEEIPTDVLDLLTGFGAKLII